VSILEVLGGTGACARPPAARQVASASRAGPELLEQPRSIPAPGISSSGDGSGEPDPGIPERHGVTHRVPAGNRRRSVRAATAGCPSRAASCPFCRPRGSRQRALPLKTTPCFHGPPRGRQGNAQQMRHFPKDGVWALPRRAK